MSKHDIEIIIVGDSKVEGCDAGCGMDWFSAEATDLAGQRLVERFGDRVQLKYVDLSEPVIEPHTLQLQQKIREGNLPLPLLLVNGQPRISGRFDIRMLLDAVEAEIEIKL